MHELSIARNIIEIIGEHVPDAERENVGTVKIRVGELSGVVNDSLEFSFSVLIKETGLKNAKLLIETVPISAKCCGCGATSRLEYGLFFCPACRSADIEITSGRELQIEHIEIND